MAAPQQQDLLARLGAMEDELRRLRLGPTHLPPVSIMTVTGSKDGPEAIVWDAPTNTGPSAGWTRDGPGTTLLPPVGGRPWIFGIDLSYKILKANVAVDSRYRMTTGFSAGGDAASDSFHFEAGANSGIFFTSYEVYRNLRAIATGPVVVSTSMRNISTGAGFANYTVQVNGYAILI